VPHPVTRETMPILGDELRKTRVSRRWTRQQLAVALSTQLGVSVSLQTLATYELGTRNVSVPRLAELCYVLGVSMSDILSNVDGRTSASAARPHEIEVDLRVIAASDRAELGPAREWARTKLVRRAGAPPPKEVVTITVEALGWLAQLCHIPTPEIVLALREA
jgi:transcriptional regulator with XRE-family HTH domain